MKKFTIREYSTLVEEHEYTIHADSYDDALVNIMGGVYDSCHRVNTFADNTEYDLIEEKNVE